MCRTTSEWPQEFSGAVGMILARRGGLVPLILPYYLDCREASPNSMERVMKLISVEE
jgi:hypothetical protein